MSKMIIVEHLCLLWQRCLFFVFFRSFWSTEWNISDWTGLNLHSPVYWQHQSEVFVFVVVPRLFDTITTPLTPSTACVRCWETRWSLHWESRCRRLRQMLTSGTNVEQEVFFLCCSLVWCGESWCLCCSEAYGLQELYQQTQDKLQARRDAMQRSVQPNKPVMDGDVLIMAVKFERSVCRRWIVR